MVVLVVKFMPLIQAFKKDVWCWYGDLQKRVRNFWIITHGQTYKQQTRKKQQQVWKVYKQWERTTEYGDNSRESERRQNACYTWYYMRRQHEKKENIYRICLCSIYSTSMNFFERFFPSSFSRSSYNFFSFLLFFIHRFSL